VRWFASQADAAPATVSNLFQTNATVSLIWEGADSNEFHFIKMRARRPACCISLLILAEGFPSMLRKVFYRLAFLSLLTSTAIAATVVPPVVVKANKTYFLLHNSNSLSGAPKRVITQQQITAAGTPSLPQVLQELGGIQLQDTSGNGTQSILSMRGFGGNATSNTLILVNGIPLTNPDMSPPDLNLIPLQEIKYIEIIAGSESVLYGDQAVGGIINIVTNTDANKKVEVSCTGGSYDAKSCYAALSSQYKNLSYGVGILSSYTDNYRVQNEYFENLFSGNLGYKYNTGKINFDTRVTQEFMQFPGALTQEQVQENRRQADNDTDYFRDWNGFYHLQQLQTLNSEWQMNTDLARRETHGHGVLTSPFTQSRSMNFINPKFVGHLQDAVITSGVDFENDNYSLNTDFGDTVDDQQKFGVFGLADVPINSRLSISAGARGAQQNNQLQSFTPLNTINRAFASTLGVAVRLWPQAQAYLRRAESFRFPKADENSDTPPGVNGLKTQRGVSYETGIKWHYKQSSSKFALYQLNLRDEIAFDPLQTPMNPFGSNTNYDPTVRRGASFSEKFLVSDRVTLGGQYNFVDAKFQTGDFAEDRIPLVAENILLANADFKISTNWNFYTEAVYTGNEYSDNDNANLLGTIGGYTVYNFNLRYHYRKFTASFRVDNIFNKYYYLYTVAEPGFAGGPSQFFYPAQARSFSINFKYSFL
jgi:iron complex outermembrane receptor protein